MHTQMKSKKSLIYLLTALLCCITLFLILPRLKKTSRDSNDILFSQLFGNKNNAFATVLCDTQMIQPTLVSLYTLKTAIAKTSPASTRDILILISKEVEINQEQLEQLEKLETKIIRTSFPQSYSSCNSIINLWALFDYEKIVYFTPDVIFDYNVDKLFELPAGSAIYADDTIPLSIIEPNQNTFESLVRDVSKRLSDNRSALSLLLANHYLERIPLYSVEKIVHVFNYPVKPWNFHQYSDTDWVKRIGALAFYKWRKASNDLRHLYYPSPQWKNDLRQRTVCDAYCSSSLTNNTFPIKDQFSILISTYNPDRIEHLSLLINHLLTSKRVHTVYITWHNPNLQVPMTLYQQDRVRVLIQTFDSLNNRFNPIDDLMTDVVYIMDDDIFIDIEDLEFTYTVWKSRPHSVVGHFPRIHTYNKETQKGTYRVSRDAPYSMILTKSMFIRSEYLFSYTCLLDPQLHEYVDEKLNCEDIGFMMMASGMSGVGSTLVSTKKPLLDMGQKKGISVTKFHMPERSQCVSDFITRFWGQQDPLILSFDTVSRFQRPFLRTGNWNRIEKIVTE